MGNLKISRVVLYLVFIGLSVFFVFIQVQLSRYSSTTFNGYPYLIFEIILNIVLGFLLGVEYLLVEASKNGYKWSLNWTKLLLIGFPSFLFAFANYFYSHAVHIPIAFLDSHVMRFYCFVLGYSISTSIIKVEDNTIQPM